MNRWKCFTVFYRFSKQCRPFSQNGTERNDKNYGKKNYRFTAVLWNGIRNFFLSPTVSTVFTICQEGRQLGIIMSYLLQSVLIATKIPVENPQ